MNGPGKIVAHVGIDQGCTTNSASIGLEDDDLYIFAVMSAQSLVALCEENPPNRKATSLSVPKMSLTLRVSLSEGMVCQANLVYALAGAFLVMYPRSTDCPRLKLELADALATFQKWYRDYLSEKEKAKNPIGLAIYERQNDWTRLNNRLLGKVTVNT